MTFDTFPKAQMVRKYILVTLSCLTYFHIKVAQYYHIPRTHVYQNQSEQAKHVPGGENTLPGQLSRLKISQLKPLAGWSMYITATQAPQLPSQLQLRHIECTSFNQSLHHPSSLLTGEHGHFTSDFHHISGHYHMVSFYNLSQSGTYPIPVGDLILSLLVIYLDNKGLAISTSFMYISIISYQHKLLGITNNTTAIVIQKLLRTCWYMNKHPDTRMTILSKCWYGFGG